MNGILLVDKPAGWSSFDAVAKVRGIVRQATGQKKPKVGHTGTLDPLATGLLVLLLGSYTKRAPDLTKLDKTYEVTIRLGQTSTTGDEEGEKTTISDVQPSQQDVETCLQNFVGDISQIPPAHSAIKINGQRAYKLARAGKSIVLEPRTIHVYTLELMDYSYPYIRCIAHVSSGTYIRTLAEDIGAQLGTGAYMSALCRTRVGSFMLEGAVSPEGLTSALVEQHLETLA